MTGSGRNGRRRLRQEVCTLALTALATLCLTASAHAAFGIGAGSYFAKAHPIAPFLTVSSGSGQASASAHPQRRIDVEAIRADAPLTQAGAHPDATASFSFDLLGNGEPEDNAKDVAVELPAGFIGDPRAVPTCNRQVFSVIGEQCPPSSQVGIASIHVVGSEIETVPVYNLVAAFGQPASFGFKIINKPILLAPHLRSDGDYGLTVTAANISDFYGLTSSTVTLWGVPADPVHDAERWNPSLVFEEGNSTAAGNWGAGSDEALVPFLSNPTWCDSGPLSTLLRARSWQEPTTWLPTDPADPTYNSGAPAPTSCSSLRFGGPAAPVGLTLQPAVHAADTPSGYEARLTLPYAESPAGLASPTLRDTTVTLPEGVVANPSSANGLAACTTQQIGYLGSGFPLPNPIRFNEEEPRCPDASKIGTVTIHTPLLEKPFEGSVYLARQFDNPFDSLLAIYLVVDDPETGIVVKLAGEVTPDPRTGRLTATFTDNPQLPFTELDLSFFGGPGAALANPPTCGTKTTSSVLTPWSAPYTPSVSSTDSFGVTAGPNGAACASTEAQLPNKPSFEAGTVSPLAGAYSPFVLKLSREDGTQRIGAIDTTLPPGLVGKLAGITYCPDAGLAAAAGRSKPGEGALEQASPSCPAGSQIGTVDVAAGAGTQPVHVQGRVYLAGPYKGAPLSLAIVTPAIAGPFDLGTVVVRNALDVNEETAQIHAVSDPIPSILEGIPLDVRSVTLNLDRPAFTLNPTSCEPMSVSGSATSTLDSVAALSNRFQVGGCNGLDFKPKLALRVFGKTNRNAKPRFRAILQAKPGEANIKRAQVNLPHSEFLEQNHIKTVCTRLQFSAGGGHGEQCPMNSIYGHAKAWSPLLEKPLQGPVYLRSSSHKLPDLVAALNGQIDIALAGKVDSGPNKGIRNTFEVVPDAPVTKFILEMKGGKKGLLVNSENLCAKGAKTTALAQFVGQNGKVENFKPKVGNSCRGGKKRTGKRR
jgi:hypothetical protein